MNKKNWGLLLLLGSADIAIAQSTSNRPPSFGAAPRINANVPDRRIGIRAAVELNYDTNVFGIGRGVERLGGLNGRSKDDFSLTPSLQLDILLPRGRNSVYARGSIGYDFYFDNSRLNRERIDLDVGGTLQATSACVLAPSIGYGRFRSNAGDVFVVTGDPTLVRRNVEERLNVGAEASCGRASGLSVTAGYRHSRNRNSAPIFQLNDLNQDAFDGSIGFQRPSLGRLAVYGNYATVEYLNRADSIKSYGTGLRFERAIGSRASGSIAAGYTWVEPRTGGDRFSGSSYSATLSLRPTERLAVDLLASRSVDFASTVFASYSITEVYSLNGSYFLTPRLSVNFGTSRQSRDFRFNPGSGIPGVAINSDTFTRAYGGVNFDLNRRLRLNALVSQQRRESDSLLNPTRGFFDYNNTTVSIGASLALGR